MTNRPASPEGGPGRRTGRIGSLLGQPILRTVLYYLALWVGLLLLRRYAPEFYRTLTEGELPTSADLSGALGGGGGQAATSRSSYPPGIAALVGMTATVVLMVPVVWIYAFTRQKRGYQQSLVQTLVMLPIVVVAVIVLVQNSLALAFGLGGVVGAVSFRNRLEDTKDTIYIFLAIGVGLACGVEVLQVGLAATLFFNVAMVVLWYTDFGRMPSQLQASVASKRVEKVKDIMGEERHTGEFVSVLDQQILQSMTPDQLELLAERALKRQRKMSDQLFGDGEKKDKDKGKKKDKDKGKDSDGVAGTDVGEAAADEPQFDGTLKIMVAEGASADGVRAIVERVLAQDTEAWEFAQASMGDFKTILEYQVRWRKSAPRPIMLETLRRTLLTQAEQVVFE